MSGISMGKTSVENFKKEVWAWLPRQNTGVPAPALSKQAGELLYEASALAKRLGWPLVAVCDVEPGQAERAIVQGWGVGRIQTLGGRWKPHPEIANGRLPLPEVLLAQPPALWLLMADSQGQVVAPLLAAEMNAVFLPGVTGITLSGTDDAACKRLVAQRPTLGDQFESLTRLNPEQGVVATLLPGAVGDFPLPTGNHGTAKTEGGRNAKAGDAADANAANGANGDLGLIPPDAETVDLSEAERIVAFGRGAFSAEAVKLVEKLAKLLGAVVAGTRPAADEGWLPFSKQVGLTGAVVRPELYVAIGISGAPYHMVGVKEPALLVAINNDREAPIFSAAHVGLEGDLLQVLPVLIAALESGINPFETPPAHGRQNQNSLAPKGRVKP